jgi:hypothetical protein
MRAAISFMWKYWRRTVAAKRALQVLLRWSDLAF